jgi:serine phosphatase RsbU (regulator of sigma subunit)/PAS domain-containing protein
MEGLVDSDAAGAGLTADLLAMLDADPHGWALATSVRVDDEIVDFELVYMNEAGSRFLGRSPAALVGRTYRQLWPETVTDGTLPLYRRVVQERVAMIRTVYYDRASVAGHFEFRIGPYGDGFLARFVDLSKLTVGPQSEGGARLYDALDAALDGFTLLRAVRGEDGGIVDFRCEYVNEIGAKLAGRTVEDLVGRRVSAVSPGSLEWGLFDRYRAVAEGARPWRQQLTSQVTGQVWDLKIVCVEVGFVAVSYREITEQIGQQELLEQAVEQARAYAARTAHLQTVTVALQAVTAAFVAANTPDEVYAAMAEVMRPAAGGQGLAVLLAQRGRLVLAHHAGYEPQVVEQLRELPLAHQYPAAGASISGQPRYLRSLAEFTAAQPDPASAVSAGSRQAWAFLPLATAGQVLGAVVIGYREPREFDADEQATLVAFSRLAAQALQRALLFQAQLSIAEDLQRALLPSVLPALTGATHAVRYLPWTQGVDVGGDWYDVIDLGPDTAAVVIGDVAGHSTQAAATMGQLRNALRAYATDGHSPTGVMQRANQLLARLEPDAIATCCYLELHLAEGTATGVLAGHPPPVLRTVERDDTVHADTVRLRTGPPLGVDPDARYLDTTFLLPPGSSLLLYTDGLVEDRRYSIDRGLDDLCAAVLSAPAPDPQVLLEHVLAADVGPHPRSDDVAILALTVDAGSRPGPLTAQRRLRGDAASAPAGRRFAADILTAWHQHSLLEDACLLLDEVITNAVQHTVGDIVVRMQLGARLRVEVHDSSERRPDKRPTDADSEVGRGLHIVEQLSRAWGDYPLPAGGKAVWFELDARPHS